MKQRYLLKDNLSFQKEHISYKQRINDIVKYVLAGGVFAVITWSLFFSSILESPKKHLLHQKNNNLISKIEEVDTKFDSISFLLSDIQKHDDQFYRVISGIKPISPEIRQAGFGGVDRYQYLDGYSNSNLLIESSKKSDIIINQLEIQTESYDTIMQLAKIKQDSLLSIPGILPVSPNGYYRISDPFGMRIHPITKKKRMHEGIDFAARVGKPIYAVGNGKIVSVRISKRGYGKHVTISHGFGFKTLYGHMNDIYVKKGDIVRRGQIIGTVGNTGSSTGPHLHYEVIYNRKKIDPKYFFVYDQTDHEYKDMAKALTEN
jgi:murein DD-endopeptidase MepM/ murein hydrolase activator NlpD